MLLGCPPMWAVWVLLLGGMTTVGNLVFLAKPVWLIARLYLVWRLLTADSRGQVTRWLTIEHWWVGISAGSGGAVRVQDIPGLGFPHLFQASLKLQLLPCVPEHVRYGCALLKKKSISHRTLGLLKVTLTGLQSQTFKAKVHLPSTGLPRLLDWGSRCELQNSLLGENFCNCTNLFTYGSPTCGLHYTVTLPLLPVLWFLIFIFVAEDLFY